jgi:hypothetical protein
VFVVFDSNVELLKNRTKPLDCRIALIAAPARA